MSSFYRKFFVNGHLGICLIIDIAVLLSNVVCLCVRLNYNDCRDFNSI